MNTTSTTLLRRVRSHEDHSAWREFADLYSPLLLHWLRKQQLSDSDAADLVQDIFVLLLEKLPNFEYDRARTFRGWLWTVTHNKLNEQRRRKKLPMGSEPFDDQSIVAVEFNDEEDRESQRILIARATELIRHEFSPQAWNLFIESAQKGEAPEVVAQKFGVKTYEVYRAKSQILKRLRSILDGMVD